MSGLFTVCRPIFDRSQRVAAYELPYKWIDDTDTTAGGGASDSGNAVAILSALLGLGLARITDVETVLVKVSEAVVLAGVGYVKDPERVVLELAHTVRPTPDVVGRCRALQDRGFRIALDNFTERAKAGPLLWIADLVTVDVLDAGDRLGEVAGRLMALDVPTLAKRVEHAAMQRRCEALGFELFQGSYPTCPNVLHGAGPNGLGIMVRSPLLPAGSEESTASTRRSPCMR